MKIAWATDVHFDSVSKADLVSFFSDIRDSGAEALLLGGDIATALDLEYWLGLLKANIFQPIYFVLGNHDYYGSDIQTVRRAVEEFSSEDLTWLASSGVVRLTDSVALVGNDGWGDARNGDVSNSPIILSDFFLIADLREASGLRGPLAILDHRDKLSRCLRSLGDQAAAMLAPALAEAASQYQMVLVLTHVPPFPESCWYNGRISEDAWLPYFTCRAIGDLLLEVAGSRPAVEFRVLCGHTHGPGRVRMAPNLVVHTGEAGYGRLFYRLIDLMDLKPFSDDDGLDCGVPRRPSPTPLSRKRTRRLR